MGASLLAKAVVQLASMLNVPPPSRASSLPQGAVVTDGQLTRYFFLCIDPFRSTPLFQVKE
ncbi:hypothetical protein EGM97_25820 [Pseudomonas sp. AF32]|nr:hypothetical protein [Pseudomonas sp. AF32]